MDFLWSRFSFIYHLISVWQNTKVHYTVVWFLLITSKQVRSCHLLCRCQARTIQPLKVTGICYSAEKHRFFEKKPCVVIFHHHHHPFFILTIYGTLTFYIIALYHNIKLIECTCFSRGAVSISSFSFEKSLSEVRAKKWIESRQDGAWFCFVPLKFRTKMYWFQDNQGVWDMFERG